jgi:hypothetical protein
MAVDSAYNVLSKTTMFMGLLTVEMLFVRLSTKFIDQIRNPKWLQL